MTLKEIFKIALVSLKSNKTRSFLTIFGIVIGITSVILLISIGKGLQSYITGQLEDLGGSSLFVIPGKFEVGTGGQSSGPPGAGVSASKFTFSHLNQLKREGKTIKAVMAYLENNATLRYHGKTHTTQVVGAGPEYPQMRNQKPQKGQFFDANQYNSAKKVVVLGQTVAEKLFSQNEPVGKKITLAEQSYTVIGVLEKKGGFAGVDMDNQAFIPATTSMRQFDMEHIQSFWVQSLNSETVTQTKTEIKTILDRSLKEDDFSVLDTQSVLNVISQVLGVLTVALAGIAAISLVVGGVGIMNIMLVSVTERTREIGLRKAVGATPKNILTQFLLEAVVLSFLGGLIGIILGVGFSLILGRFITTKITFWSISLAFGVASIVGIVFGLTPAARAAKLNPIVALRYE